MIRTEVFVRQLWQAGFRVFSGTPCSYLTPLINRVIDADEARYVGAANEGDAVAIAAGAELGGALGVVLFQNSGLGNAVSPLTSLTFPLRIPVLVLATWRGHPGGPPDEPQHELMGSITPALLELMGIPWEAVTPEEDSLPAAIGRAMTHMREQRRPWCMVLREGIFCPHALQKRAKPVRHFVQTPTAVCPGVPAALDQDDVLRCLRSALQPTDALLATTGYTGRALYALGDTANQLYMVGSMGCVSSLALGLALTQPRRRVIAIDGDGAVLMRMGALAVLGQERPPNLIHVVLDNGVHDSTGSQATPATTTDLAAVASACGYPRVVRVSDLGHLQDTLRHADAALTFVHVLTRPRDNRKLPRPKVTPAEVAERFRQWLRTTT
jgi:phosphonopyruvate decarboxylase